MTPTLAVLVVLATVGGATIGYFVDVIVRWGLRDSSAGSDGRRVRILLAVSGALTLGLTTVIIGAHPDVLAWWWFAGFSIVLIRGDVLRHRLPDRLVFPAFGGGCVLLAGGAFAQGEMSSLVRALLSAGLVGLGYLVLAVITPSGLGMGDVKLAPFIGLYLGWLGWPSVVEGVFAGFVIGALWALLLLAVRRAGLQTHLPFGPSMLLGVAVAAVLHNHV